MRPSSIQVCRARAAGLPNGHDAFTGTLAQDPGGLARPVEVGALHPDQLGDPHPGRVEQLEHRDITLVHRPGVIGAQGSRQP